MILFLFSMDQTINTNNFNKITQDINIFKGSFPKTGKIIGIDLGKKTLGIAISDNYRKIALTHKTIFRKTATINNYHWPFGHGKILL